MPLYSTQLASVVLPSIKACYGLVRNIGFSLESETEVDFAADSQVIGEQKYLDLEAPPFRPESKIA